jgi:hypothetical protein
MINIELENKVTEALNNLGKIVHNNVPRDIDDLISDFYSIQSTIFKNIASADMSPELMERIMNKLSCTKEILSEIDDDYLKGIMTINLLISDFDRLDNSNFMCPVSSMGHVNIIGGCVGPGKSTVGNTKHYSGMKSGEMSSSGKVRILPDFFTKSPNPAVMEAMIRGVKSGISITSKDEPPIYQQPVRKYIIDNARFLKELENDIIESFDVTHTLQKRNTVSHDGILHLKKLVKRPKGRK